MLDGFAITAIGILAVIAAVLGIVIVAKWQHRSLWAATPVVLWPTSTIYVQAAIVAVLAIGTVIGSRSRIHETKRPILLFLGFALCMVIVLIVHGPPEVVEPAAARNLLIAMLLGIAVVPITALQRPPLIPSLKALALSGAAVSVYVLATYGVLGGRVASETHNPNAIGLAASLAFLSALGVALLTRRSRWILVAVPSLMLFAGTQNRSGLIVIAVGAVLLWLLQRTSRTRVVGAMVVLSAAPFVIDIVLASQSALFSRRQTVNFGVEARFEVLSLALRLAIEHPFLGVGWRHFTDESLRTLDVALNTHNDYALVAAEGGLLAFVLFVGIVVRGLTFRDPTKEGRALQALALAAGLTLFFGNMITDFRVTWPLWVLIGMAWSSTRDRERPNSAANERLGINAGSPDSLGTLQTDRVDLAPKVVRFRAARQVDAPE